MGCDIHLFLEIKLDDEWVFYSKLNIKRDYRIFTKMCGVRAYDDSIQPISPPRGLPKDISPITELFVTKCVGSHSHSFLNSKEISELHNFIENIYDGCNPPWDGGWSKPFGCWLFGNAIHDLNENKEDYPEELEDIRFVFFFDN